MKWVNLPRILSIKRSIVTIPVAASAMAKRGAEIRKEQGRALAYARLEELRADIAAGRIAHLGWKQ